MDALEWFAKKIFQNLPIIFGVGILFMDLVAISAPILAHLGFTSIAHVIYTIYSFLCHQRPWRSLHLFGYQFAWCTRDTFIYLSMSLAAFSSVKFRIRGIKWYVPILCLIPFAFDGTVQLIAEILGIMKGELTFFYASTNFVRMLTGTIFGAGAGLWIFGLLAETIEEELNINSKSKINLPAQSAIRLSSSKSGSRGGKLRNLKLRNLYCFIAIVGICFVVYVGILQLWRITSSEYKPSGLLDNVRYFPGVNYEKVDRCGHCV